MPTIEAKVVRVAVGVIRREKLVLISKRPKHLHKGGMWEFPGGKVEMGESLEEALARELKEELGIAIGPIQQLFDIDWAYPEKRVKLEICLVDQFSGEPRGVEGQPVKWVSADQLSDYQFPEANQEIVTWLRRSS